MTTAAMDRMAGPARTMGGPRPRKAAMRRTVMLRRRLAAALVVAVTVLAVCVALALSSQAAPEAGILEVSVVVGPGETVWDIAGDYLPAGENRHTYVASILRHNGVDASAVSPGTVLQLPRP